ncbi:META domain-containing protein [Gaetbulibacter sp. M235]|uniref:META domain-containing protein n=1 Tax=Gaetbulibacter sp. M235 TaxID=3126510 RepID=UPI00374F30A1
MKKNLYLFVSMLTLLFVSCASTNNSNNKALFGNTWELDYLSGPRIAFEGLFPDKKPKITFNKTTNKVEGNNSCNGYSADYTLNGDEISFGEPGPTTMMFCGEGEKFFLNTIKKINKYKIDSDGKLNLMIGDVPMMRFKKIADKQ